MKRKQEWMPPDDELSAKMDALGFVESPIPDPPNPRKRSPPKSDLFHYVVERSDRIFIRRVSAAPAPEPEVSHQAGGIRYVGREGNPQKLGLFVDNDGHSDRILPGFIMGLFPVNQDLFVFSGIFDWCDSYGFIHVIRNCHENTRPERLALLPEGPRFIGMKRLRRYISESPTESPCEPLDPDFALFAIASDSALLDFHPDDRLQILQFNPCPHIWRPTSVVREPGMCYVGLPTGVLCVPDNPINAFQIRYFVPKY